MTLAEAEKLAKIVLQLGEEGMILHVAELEPTTEAKYRATLVKNGRSQFAQEGETAGAALLKLLAFYGADLQRRVDDSQRLLEDWRKL